MTALGLQHVRSGKVRDIYEVDHDRLLIVASDRISAFDVVMDEPIPDKGRVLTGLSTFWFERTTDLVANHVISADPTDFPETAGADVAGRAMLVRRATPLPMECVVRGYLFGSAWSEYQKESTVNGMPMPSGMQQAEELPAPIFTPSTKADEGHDVALTRDEAIALVGAERHAELERLSIELYQFGAELAATRGIIVADTKFEFGEIDGAIVLIDEVLTPDSSRFWPADEYRLGTSPPSFDKQYVRDHFDSVGWDHEPPAPPLPADVIAGTRARYIEAYECITQASFDQWYAPDGS
ncbi:MAG TPA: phosphoribosylaminoimidazolesuccinocarboxamide synthase [Acidimicrobiia bacterium]|nr:phosphoribosylaminoimidazolesuccinocarboxamide synthase [Acidimicrobiia bacterium]